MMAAGVSGVLKILLQLQHKTLVPTLNCEKPHARFKFDESPFYPNTTLKPWEQEENKRRAAISSFGFGGTNCHMIIEEGDNEMASRQPIPVERRSTNYYWLGHEIVKQDLTKEAIKHLKTETFVHNEPYLRDHIVEHEQVILGVTYASLLVESLKEAESLSLKNLLFKDPVILNKSEKATVKVLASKK